MSPLQNLPGECFPQWVHLEWIPNEPPQRVGKTPAVSLLSHYPGHCQENRKHRSSFLPFPLCHTLCLLSMGISQRVFWFLQTKLCVLTHAEEINPTYLQSLHYISVAVGCPFPSSWKLGPLQRMAGARGAHRALLTSVWKHPADAGHAAALHSSCGCPSGLGTAVQWLNKLLIACAVPCHRSPIWNPFT